jgi:serine O-acetyltransferase
MINTPFKQDLQRLKKSTRSTGAFITEILSPGFLCIVSYRIWSFFRRKRIPLFPIRLFCEKAVELITSSSIPSKAQIGGGLRIQHFGQIMIHDSVIIGKNATIYNGVTIGLKHDTDLQGPILGDNVYIGTGAKILGAIKIGNNVSVGANAVVLTDVPDNSLAVGIPARIISQKSKEADPCLHFSS